MSDDHIPYHRIAQRFYNQPLWLSQPAAETISQFLLTEMSAGPQGGRGSSRGKGESVQAFRATPAADGNSVEIHSARASAFHGSWAVDDGGRPLPFLRTAGGTAIITVVGELVNRGAWIGADSGLVSYEGIKHQIEKATADPKTSHIVLDIESPGGEAIGAFEVAAAVRAAAKVKPVTAVANGMAASAAYALASGASRLVVPPSGVAGSIGVIMVHLDYSEFLKEKGIKPTLIFTGAHKVDGNPFEPLPDSVRERFQKVSASFYDQFVETVAAGRPGLSAQRIRATEALMFKGQDAVDAGLADSVATFEEVLAEISRGSTGRSTTSANNMKGSTMDKPAAGAAGAVTTEATTAITTLDQLRAAHPALCTELMTTSASAERARIAGIDELEAKGHDAIVVAAKADGKSTAADVALAINKAEKASRAQQLANLSTGVEDAAKSLQTANTATGGAATDPKPEANTPEAWKAAFAASKDLQAEFGSADGYVAFQQGVLDGTIRRLVRKA